MSSPEGKDTRRISVDLPNQLVERFDQLKREWGLRGRGAVLKRLLEEILCEYSESDEEIDNTSTFSEQNSSGDSELSKLNNDTNPKYNETAPLVLITRDQLTSTSTNCKDNIQRVDNSTKDSRFGAPAKGGIDLPGFVRKRTATLRDSLSPVTQQKTLQEPLVTAVLEAHLHKSIESVRSHWHTLYGQSPQETVVEAAMIWLARDIWPQVEDLDSQPFTWTAANRKMAQLCPTWQSSSPKFENVIVVAGVLEDPFATANLAERIPTLIRRFVNKFKRSRNVTSFQTLESTMTVHGALKILDLPTEAGSALTLTRIREAYKQKALAMHPDAGGTTESMRRVNEGYQLLKELYRR